MGGRAQGGTSYPPSRTGTDDPGSAHGETLVMQHAYVWAGAGTVEYRYSVRSE